VTKVQITNVVKQHIIQTDADALKHQQQTAISYRSFNFFYSKLVELTSGLHIQGDYIWGLFINSVLLV
jgi:hypothetical protein